MDISDNCAYWALPILNTHWTKKLFKQDFPWVDRLEVSFWHSSPLVIVGDLNIGRASFCPNEADPVLVVNANAELSHTVAR
mgnify:CR=1 FL=1